MKVLGSILQMKSVVINKTSQGSKDGRYSNGYLFLEGCLWWQEPQRKYGGPEARSPSPSLPMERFNVETQPLLCLCQIQHRHDWHTFSTLYKLSFAVEAPKSHGFICVVRLHIQILGIHTLSFIKIFY